VPGENLVRISQAGHLLSLEISPSSNLDSASLLLSPLTLSQLLTGVSSNATGVTVNSDGSVQLTNSDLGVEAGDVAIADTQATGANQKVAVSAQTATVSAARNLTLANRQLQTAGDLKLQAGEAVRIRDSTANSFVIDAGGNLAVQGDRQIDIQARNNSQSLLNADGRITLTSNGTVSSDAFFRAGSDFSIATLQGSPGNFASSGVSTIISGGNVAFGNYAGASLGAIASLGFGRSQNITSPRGDVEALYSRLAPPLPPERPDVELKYSGSAPTLPPEIGVLEPLYLPSITPAVPTLGNSGATPSAPTVLPLSVPVSNTQLGNPNSLVAQQSSLNGERNQEQQRFLSLTASANQ